MLYTKEGTGKRLTRKIPYPHYYTLEPTDSPLSTYMCDRLRDDSCWLEDC